MASGKSYAPLGLFIVATLIVVLVTAVFFIERLKNRASIAMVTYTKENVFGLDVSSSVRLRGVPVGRVTGIRVDPKGDMVEIDFEVFLDRLNTIGLDVKRIETITGVRRTYCSISPRILPRRSSLDSNQVGLTFRRCPRCLLQRRIGCLRCWIAPTRHCKPLQRLSPACPLASIALTDSSPTRSA